MCLLLFIAIATLASVIVAETVPVSSDKVIPVTSIAEAQIAIDCPAFLQPIMKRRNSCLASHNGTEVDVCVYFASDYEFLIPFLVHHLSLGASHIFVYNNDDKIAWYRHPAILCLIAEGIVQIQPWFGEKALMKGLNHCFRHSIPEIRGKHFEKDNMELMNIWGANFDVDEMLVLHKHTCMAELVKYYQAPTLALNWAFFVPERSPSAGLSDFGRTGNIKHMPADHNNYDLHGVLLPHDKLLRRMYENPHIKSVNRVGCVELWHNEHCPNYRASCPFETRPKDPENHTLNCQPWTPWIDNNYPTAQLNHYWTLSLADFLRKIHRGKGGSYSKQDGSAYRHTGEFHGHATPARVPFVNDVSLIERHGAFFAELKQICPLCFDTALYHLQE
mmetsp:Transcript_1340/g.2173  ORF Transcript_1340/g.2173 Transcript_1340/m.2173 type:complete len:389 (+) Transcript_1340:54-1220(+)